jgi:hypothetical protein
LSHEFIIPSEDIIIWLDKNNQFLYNTVVEEVVSSITFKEGIIYTDYIDNDCVVYDRPFTRHETKSINRAFFFTKEASKNMPTTSYIEASKYLFANKLGAHVAKFMLRVTNG